MSNDVKQLNELCKLVRYNIMTATTAAGSGHPTSSLSAVELMTTIFFGGFLNYDLQNPHNLANDRVIFSKGHAAPLLYSLYQVAGVISREELLTLRKFDSVLEGHPTPRFKYIDVATGSLGQGLSIGVGMALGMKLRNKNTEMKIPNVYVLIGDSEMAEGQVWEAMALASHYKLNNLIAIVDVNRLGQRGETMLGWDIDTYAKRAKAFGWNVITLTDGNNLEQVVNAFKDLNVPPLECPTMIVAKTIKGKGIKALEDKDNWHGKALPKDQLPEALRDIGKVDLNLKGATVNIHQSQLSPISKSKTPNLADLTSSTHYKIGDLVATREAYGDALASLGSTNKQVVVIDAETSNSTYAERFKKTAAERFFEMYIAEQNMISTAVGLSKVGYVPFASSFAAFLTRAFDQIRMAQYSEANIKIAGSHAGVSIGVDGSSQMALEDLSMMRSILYSVVLYPSDAICTIKLVNLMASTGGLIYMRTTREKTPLIYSENETFEVGGSKIVKHSEKDTVVIFTAGITLHESLKAYEELKKQNIHVAIVDLYSIKPLDEKTINKLAKKLQNVIVVEDHYPYGGIGEAVKSVLDPHVNFIHLAVTKIPRSGKPEELLSYEGIDAKAIILAVRSIK